MAAFPLVQFDVDTLLSKAIQEEERYRITGVHAAKQRAKLLLETAIKIEEKHNG